MIIFLSTFLTAKAGYIKGKNRRNLLTPSQKKKNYIILGGIDLKYFKCNYIILLLWYFKMHIS